MNISFWKKLLGLCYSFNSLQSIVVISFLIHRLGKSPPTYIFFIILGYIAITNIIGLLFGVGLLTNNLLSVRFSQIVAWLFIIQPPFGTILGFLTLLYYFRQHHPAAINSNRNERGASIAPMTNLQIKPSPSVISPPIHVDKDKVHANKHKTHNSLRHILYYAKLLLIIVPIPAMFKCWEYVTGIDISSPPQNLGGGMAFLILLPLFIGFGFAITIAFIYSLKKKR
jgi:hypothetical protein